MVKFHLVVALPVALTVQNRVVCDVTETRHESEDFGKFIQWRGTVNEEYFSILFVKGLLNVTLAEREMQLGEEKINYALSEKAFNISSDPNEAINLMMGDDINEDFDKLTFVDIMVALNWKYGPNVKVWVDDLC